MSDYHYDENMERVEEARRHLKEAAARLREVIITATLPDESCGACGANTLVLHTQAEQDNPEHIEATGYDWFADPDDQVLCTECGAEHYVEIDWDGIAWIHLVSCPKRNRY
jgi:hypothetical protein